MAEDFRVTATLEQGSAHDLLEHLHRHELEGEMEARVGQRVAVSADGPHLYLYADTEPAARSAEQIVSDLLTSQGVQASFELTRWHPIAEDWEPVDAALPQSEEEIEAEHDRLEATEDAEADAVGYAEWEVRLDLPSHGAAVDLAERLSGEGFPLTRRWKYLLVGARDEDEAAKLAERLRAEAPPGTELHVQPGGEVAWEFMPRNPFAIFGGLGG